MNKKFLWGTGVGLLAGLVIAIIAAYFTFGENVQSNKSYASCSRQDPDCSGWDACYRDYMLERDQAAWDKFRACVGPLGYGDGEEAN